MDLIRQRAHWIDRSTLAWRVEGPVGGRRYDLVWSRDGTLSIVDGALVGPHGELRLRHRPAGLSAAQRAAWPHLRDHAAFTLEADLDMVREALRGQLAVTARDEGGWLMAVTGVQVPGVLDDVYAAATGARLGPTFEGGRPTLAVWAPTARAVALELEGVDWDVPMWRDHDTGVWSVSGERDWTGRRYRYRVEVWHPATRLVETAAVTDPYAVALTADSTHAIIADLDDPALAPAGWAELCKPPAVRSARAHVQETHVRDFSIMDPSVPAERRGTYLAFTDPASVGMRHLRRLADAGVTHLHLLPVFDISTVPERRADQAAPEGDLAALPPDSPGQQEAVAAVADRDGYNWGYDPLHYSVPEGAYAVAPDGGARVAEFRAMVAGLNGIGLRVVMDVVYNHTVAAGTHPQSVLDRVVPGYYHRLLDDGRVADSTCCANTAPEHAMMGKLVVDSVVRWAVQYKVDGFRFDLMGHHPRANVLAVRAALDRLTPWRDGVDGRAVLMYGEGWNFGEVVNDARFPQASQLGMAGTGVGTFNDRMRDALRGGGAFENNPRVQGFATGLFTDPNGDGVNGSSDEQRSRLLHDQDLLKVGLSGNLADYRFVASHGTAVSGSQVQFNGWQAGYNATPGESVTYVDAHDNEILYDALVFKLPHGTSMVDRVRMQVLALSFVVFGQGMGFVAAGSERLRSKSLDRNSYNSGDWFNAIRWDPAAGNGFGIGLPPAGDNQDKWGYARPLLADRSLVPDAAEVEMATARYVEMLRIRTASSLFGLATLAEVQAALTFPLSGPGETPGVVTMRLAGAGEDLVVVFNATTSTVTQDVPGAAGYVLHPVLAESVDPALRTASFAAGVFTVPARSVAVFTRLP
jgi:pullulanase-type alpha-1,6-glucosidase